MDLTRPFFLPCLCMGESPRSELEELNDRPLMSVRQPPPPAHATSSDHVDLHLLLQSVADHTRPDVEPVARETSSTLRIASQVETPLIPPAGGDIALTYLKPRFSLSAGARRYRPYFSLWTLWGAFSPVPYNAVNISAETRLTSRISINGRAEHYKYDDAEVSTALVPQLEDRGRLDTIRDQLTRVESKEFWEIIDRGRNFEYMPPRQRDQMEKFFSLLDATAQ